MLLFKITRKNLFTLKYISINTAFNNKEKYRAQNLRASKRVAACTGGG